MSTCHKSPQQIVHEREILASSSQKFMIVHEREILASSSLPSHPIPSLIKDHAWSGFIS
jgi:hypothetical protein